MNSYRADFPVLDDSITLIVIVCIRAFHNGTLAVLDRLLQTLSEFFKHSNYNRHQPLEFLQGSGEKKKKKYWKLTVRLDKSVHYICINSQS